MMIEGNTLNDNVNAGVALVEACKKVNSNVSVEIGSYRGFAMHLSYEKFSNIHQLTLKGAMSHSVKLGMDARGNLTRIDNALAFMSNRLKDVTEQLDILYKQQIAAKNELGKPFLQEQELKDKVSRLAYLDAELNMDMEVSKPQEQIDKCDIKNEKKLSILEQLQKSKKIIIPKKNLKNKFKHLEI